MGNNTVAATRKYTSEIQELLPSFVRDIIFVFPNHVVDDGQKIDFHMVIIV